MLIWVQPLQLDNRDEATAEGAAEDEAEDEVVVVGTVGEDKVVDMDATTIIYLMISIGTLTNLPTINWFMMVSLVVKYNLTMWIVKPFPSIHPRHHLLYPWPLQLRPRWFLMHRLLSPHLLVKFIPLM